jgi:hypothetical protein
MPGSRLTPRNGYPLSTAELRKVMGRGVLHDFLEYGARETCHIFDDFLGDTINLDNYAVANSGGTAAASFAISAAANGIITGTPGTDDNASMSLVLPLIWSGDANCGMEIAVKLTTITTVQFETGFIDAVPGSNAPGITDIDTPAIAGSDSALFGFDTAQTLKTCAFVTDGATTGQDCIKTTVSPAFTPTAGSYFVVRIQLVGNHAYCWLNGRLVASHSAVAAGAVEGGTLLAPWVYVKNKSAATHVTSLDYLRVWADRV